MNKVNVVNADSPEMIQAQAIIDYLVGRYIDPEIALGEVIPIANIISNVRADIAKNNSVNESPELSTAPTESGKTEQGLLPCPRCGGGAEVFPEESDTGYYVMCAQPNYPVEECWLSLGEEYDRDGMPEHRFQTKEDAMAAWNVRNIAPKPDSEVEAALKELREMFPRGFCEIMFPTESGTEKNHLANVVIAVWDSTRSNGLLSHFDGTTLAEAMALVRDEFEAADKDKNSV